MFNKKKKERKFTLGKKTFPNHLGKDDEILVVQSYSKLKENMVIFTSKMSLQFFSNLYETKTNAKITLIHV